MKELVFYFYGYIIFFYSMGLIISYVVLMWLAEVGILRRKNAYLTPYAKYIIDSSRSSSSTTAARTRPWNC